MSDTLTTLAQYLLAYQFPGGGRLCKMGTVYFTVPVYPPGVDVTYQTIPAYGSYCSIVVWQQFSPAMVPNTMFWDARHEGIIFQSGLLTALFLSESHTGWIEVTQNNPIVHTLRNDSGVNQYFENRAVYLVVQTEGDLKLLHELVGKYGNAGGKV